MPTTDPGSDLLFSTDDEYNDNNGVVTCYGTMPPRVKRHLLKSELQRHYMQEIGDDLKNMPPELIITSPSNKGKQKNHSIRILYKSTAANKYEGKFQTTTELPLIGQPTKRTRSWHNLNTDPRSVLLTPSKANVTKNKSQSPFYRSLTKKETLTKEDLDIKLSLKKKIWAGLQPDDITLAIDRTRPLTWITPTSLKNKKLIDDQNLCNDLNFAKLSNNYNNKKLNNEAFLTACSRKLMEWQVMSTSPENYSPSSQKTKVSLKLIIPEINENRSMFVFKDSYAMKTPNAETYSTNLDTEINNEIKIKRTSISKTLEASKIFTKISKSKSRNSLPTAHRSTSKQNSNSHKASLRHNKFKTGGLVVTAVQTGTSIGAAGSKKNKKLKSLHYKLPNVNGCNVNDTDFIETCTASKNSDNKNKKDGLIMATTATTIVKKVKTKLKKKKTVLSKKPSETTI